MVTKLGKRQRSTYYSNTDDYMDDILADAEPYATLKPTERA
jgi:hypothetical protein